MLEQTETQALTEKESPPGARLRQVSFHHEGRSCTAVIGKPITNWLDSSAAVTDLVEFGEQVEIQMQMVSGQVLTVRLSADQIAARLYAEKE